MNDKVQHLYQTPCTKHQWPDDSVELVWTGVFSDWIGDMVADSQQYGTYAQVNLAPPDNYQDEQELYAQSTSYSS